MSTPQGTAAGLYSKMEADRTPYIEDGIKCAELTIPSLFPRQMDGHAKLPTPYQSVGARGVNNLAAKLMLAVLPANTPLFRLKIEDEVLEAARQEQNPNIKTKVEQQLGKVERRVCSSLESKALHPTAFEMFKHLIVVGNGLLYLPDEGRIKFYSLHSYVVARDYMGNPLEIVLKEKIAKVALPAEIQKAIATGPDKAMKMHDEVELFTHVKRNKDNWYAYQEVAGMKVPGSTGTYPLDKCPWIALRLIKQDGKPYGRSYVHEYLGDLLSLEGLSQALLEGAIAAAKVLFLVNPNGTTEKKDLEKVANGGFADGSAADVQALQLQKYNDFRVAFEQSQKIEERLLFAFLLNSAVQRGGERVTAEEIRYVARELEDSLGGIYSLLSQDLQMPLVAREMYVLTKQKKIAAFPKDTVQPVIITGMEALGRGNDLAKLELAMSKVQVLGPEVVAANVNASDYIDRVFTACGVDTDGLIKTEEQKQAEQEQAMQQQLMQQGLSPAIQAGGKLMQQGMQNDQSQAGPSGP